MSYGKSSATGQRDIERMVERWERAPHPIDLPAGLVARTGKRREGAPVKVRAAIPVHYSYSDVLVAEGEVIAWTDSAVLVRVTLPPSNHTREIWLWAAAVQRT